jgi:chromosome segregation ATPase
VLTLFPEQQEDQERVITSMQQSLEATKKLKKKKKQPKVQNINIYEKQQKQKDNMYSSNSGGNGSEKYIIAERIVDLPPSSIQHQHSDYIKPEKYAELLTDFEVTMDKVRFLETDNDLLRKQNKDLLDQVKQQKHMSEFDKEHQQREFDQQRHDYEKIIKDLQRDLRTQEKKIQEQQLQLQLHKDKLEQSYRDEARHRQSIMQHSEQYSSKVDRMEQHIHQQQAKIEKQEEQIRILHDTLDQRNEQLRRAEIQKEDQIRMLNETVDKKLRQVEQQKDQNWLYEYTNEKVEKEFINERLRTVEKERERLEKEVSDLKSANERMLQDIQNLNQQKNKNKESDKVEIDGMKFEILKYRETVKVLQQKLQKYKKRIRQLEESFADSSRRVIQLEHEQQQQQQQDSILTDEETDKRAITTDVKTQTSNHKINLSSGTQTRGGFQKDTYMQTSLNRPSDDSILALENTYKQNMDQIEKLQSNQLKLERDIADLKRQLQDSQDQNKLLLNRLDESNNHIETLNSEVQTNVSQLEVAWGENTNLKQQLNKLASKLQKLESTRKLLKKELEYKESEVIKRNRFIHNLVQPTLHQALTNPPHQKQQQQ